MILKIKFEVNSDLLNDLIPNFVRFTSSINEETSTITLNFYNPLKLLNLNILMVEKKSIKATLLLDCNLKYTTKDIKIIWVKGKPFILQVVFLLTSKVESKKLKIYLEKNNLLN